MQVVSAAVPPSLLPPSLHTSAHVSLSHAPASPWASCLGVVTSTTEGGGVSHSGGGGGGEEAAAAEEEEVDTLEPEAEARGARVTGAQYAYVNIPFR
jgi:hypothetical protein